MASKVVKSNKQEIINNYQVDSNVKTEVIYTRIPPPTLSRGEISELAKQEAHQTFDDILKSDTIKKLSKGNLADLPYHGEISGYTTISVLVPIQLIRSYIIEFMDDYGLVSSYVRQGLGPGESGTNAKILIQNNSEHNREFILSWS